MNNMSANIMLFDPFHSDRPTMYGDMLFVPRTQLRIDWGPYSKVYRQGDPIPCHVFRLLDGILSSPATIYSARFGFSPNAPIPYNEDGLIHIYAPYAPSI